jgi:integrase
VGYPALRNMMQDCSREIEASVSPHDLRRFALGSMWLGDPETGRPGMDQSTVMAISGHRQVRVFERYTKAVMMQKALTAHRMHSPLAKLHLERVKVPMLGTAGRSLAGTEAAG